MSAPPSCNRRRAPTSNGKGAEEGQEKGEAMERERERGEKEGEGKGDGLSPVYLTSGYGPGAWLTDRSRELISETRRSIMEGTICYS